MPVHNEPENVLRTAINSILKQTFTDFEFIIINDASENNAEEVILSYNDDRIKYYKNEVNLKVIKTLNKGLELATCEYIARMDADDISFRTRLEKQVKLLDENPEIGLVSAQCYIMPKRQLITPPENHIEIEKILKYCVNCVVHPVAMFRKSVITNNNLKYSENHLHIEDYKLWIDMSNVTKLHTIQEPLVWHRDWDSSVSRKYSKLQMINAKMLVFESILEDVGIKNENLVAKYKKSLEENRITQEDFLEIDTAINLAKRKTIANIHSFWKQYILNTLEELRNSVIHKTPKQ